MNIVFNKNRFPFGSQQKQLAIDCHFHSSYSDGASKIEEILAKAKKKNIGVAITDHNEIRGVLNARENDLHVPIIPGIEVSCKGMIHLLLYFYNCRDLKIFFDRHVAPYRRVNPNASLKQMTALKIAKLAKQFKCLVCLAHPYGGVHRGIESYMKVRGNEKFLSYIDCIEALNGTVSKKRNLKSYALARRMHKGIIGGSDGHTLTALGNTITIARATTIDAFLHHLKAGTVRIVGKKANLYQRSKMAGIISYKHINASTKEHRKEIITSLGLYAAFQSLAIPFLFLLGSYAYKKIKTHRFSKR